MTILLKYITDRCINQLNVHLYAHILTKHQSHAFKHFANNFFQRPWLKIFGVFQGLLLNSTEIHQLNDKLLVLFM